MSTRKERRKVGGSQSSEPKLGVYWVVANTKYPVAPWAAGTAKLTYTYYPYWYSHTRNTRGGEAVSTVQYHANVSNTCELNKL